jgi:hypothetical protein
VVVWILLGLAAVVLLVIAAVVNVWRRAPTLHRDGD